jgi:hypothetical protein
MQKRLPLPRLKTFRLKQKKSPSLKRSQCLMKYHIPESLSRNPR